MKLQKSNYARYIGVDVSKASLEIDDSAGLVPASIDNDPQVIVKSLVSSIDSPDDTLVICEATGGYERKLVAAMHATGIPVMVANPRQVRDFAKGHGILEKNDSIDAVVIRHFGQDVRNLTLAVPKTDNQEKHGALVRRRKQLLDMINQEKNRLQQTADSDVVCLIQDHLESLKKQLEHVDQQLKKPTEAGRSKKATPVSQQVKATVAATCSMRH